MANTDKDILVTPATSTAGLPSIKVVGTTASPIYIRALDDGSVSFEGTNGQLFSISDSFSGSIFSVNDISGIPSIEVLDTGLVKIAEYSGNVAIGQSTSAYKLAVNGTVAAVGGFVTPTYTTGARNPIWRFGNADGYGLSYFQSTAGITNLDTIGFHFGTASAAGSPFQFVSNGNFIATGDITTNSDEKIKENIKPIENALSKVLSLNGVTYNLIHDNNKKEHMGLIAQNVEQYAPEVVIDNGNIKSVAYGNLVGLLVEAIKELQSQVAELRGKVDGI